VGTHTHHTLGHSVCNLQVALIDGIADVMHASSLGDRYAAPVHRQRPKWAQLPKHCKEYVIFEFLWLLS